MSLVSYKFASKTLKPFLLLSHSPKCFFFSLKLCCIFKIPNIVLHKYNSIFKSPLGFFKPCLHNRIFKSIFSAKKHTYIQGIKPSTKVNILIEKFLKHHPNTKPSNIQNVLMMASIHFYCAYKHKAVRRKSHKIALKNICYTL